MTFTPALLATLLGAVAYAASAIRLLAYPAGRLPSWVVVLLTLGLGLQGYVIALTTFPGGQMVLGFGNSASIILWLSVLAYGLSSLRYPMSRVQGWLAAGATIGIALPLVIPGMRLIPYSNMPGFRVHLTLALLAYSLLFIASVQAILMGTLEKRLHRKSLGFGSQDLPPLLTLETLLFRLIGAGFLILTLALASGIFFSEEVLGQAIPFTHKTVFALLSWLVFGGLLAGRRLWGWRGRIAARWTVTGFVMLVLAYMGTKFVLEVLLNH